MNYLGLNDIVWIASQVLRIEPEVLLRASRINSADSAVHAPGASFGGVEFQPGLVRKVAVLGYRLVRNHPFPDGNKRVAFLAMIEMAERNGTQWVEPPDDPEGDETVEMMLAAAAGTVDEETFVEWVKTRVI
ncbi:MAG: type II toxin-antitoxin system death-on-curing family toxin [Candidatus Microthrix subdominans]